MAKFNPGQFLQEVRAEARKVTWPTRNETLVTTGIVFVMVIVASLFFLIADRIISWLVSLVLGFGQ
jgi:preprotein translocase subunit SecE